MRRRGGGGIPPERRQAGIRANSWWDNPGQPTPYVLWGLVWCRCGTAMVPLDRRRGPAGTERLYRCDAGCGRRPIPAGGLEREVLRAVVDTALTQLPRYTLPWMRALRVARHRGGPDRRRELIRGWIDRVVTDGGQPPELYWQADTAVPAQVPAGNQTGRAGSTTPVTSPSAIVVPSGPAAVAAMVTVSPSSRKVRVEPSASLTGSVPPQVSSRNEPT